ncbi:site-specific integrase [Bradyrhizobium diazoefficiens]|uniref:Phage integrase n=1 Tax=Bradyrhizobium diazoefficiens TaxID=1355477 RepID=A0A809ZRW1_9BRAD|nr:integrase arm-type DNA-binding domain-containing protein [Bradyrhizobium diazoefficiens]BBZ93043.1 phage integrase [Bradyrhizobium diazoefficiens]BCA10793.1 phage integrase [Bradyrhizobium diazoefficiens]BCE55129.1 phage integrase [Bradyrhizobium diazoefficiens]BCE63862.1 phage integrase [Bradyrhizobium diazoefficiens]
MSQASAQAALKPAKNPKAIPPERRTEADIPLFGPGDHHFGNGLYLRVEHRGSSRKWFTKPTCIDASGEKKRRPFTIGNPDQVRLEAARELAIQIHKWADGGLDVRRELDKLNEAQVVVPTFGQHAEAFIARHSATLKSEAQRANWGNPIYNHIRAKGPAIWSLRVDEIYVNDVIEVLEPIWKTIPVMAASLRAQIEMIIGDAANRYSITRLQNFNPAKWTKSLQHSLGGRPPKSGETRGAQLSVAYKDIPALMIELRNRQCQSARAIYAITLTALRWQEFIKMRMDELDLDAEQPTWTIPFSRFKYDTMHKQPFVLPLSPQLVEIIREQIAELEAIYGPGNFDYIWPGSVQGRRGGRPADHMSSGTMLGYLQRSMNRPDATIHGFRASFETWSDDQFIDGTKSPKYHPHAVEFCLAHVAPGGKTKRAYRRGMMFDARIGIMNDWADFCVPRASAVAIDDSNIVKFRPTA